MTRVRPDIGRRIQAEEKALKKLFEDFSENEVKLNRVLDNLYRQGIHVEVEYFVTHNPVLQDKVNTFPSCVGRWKTTIMVEGDVLSMHVKDTLFEVLFLLLAEQSTTLRPLAKKKVDLRLETNYKKL